MRPTHWINFVIGIWLLASSFMELTAQAMQTNLMVAGILVAALALWGAMSYSSLDQHPSS